MSNRRARVGDRRRSTGKTPTKFGKRLFETLEPRRLLAVASLPSEPLNTVAHPIAVESGLIDDNATADLVVLGRDGQLAVALNSGQNSWQSAKTLPLELGAAYGMASGWLEADASLDLVVVGNDSAKVLLGDRRGGFQLAATLAAPAGAGWQPTDDNAAGIAVGNLDSDLALDVVLLDTQANRVFVWYGRGDGTFLPPQAFPSGGADPISVAIGDVVGDPRPDIVVGHRDGSLSFLEGSDEREFRLNAEDTLHKADAIRSLAAGDVDQDGDWDVVGASGSEAWVLRRQPHPLATPPIVNGDFSEGLLGWKVESVGQQPGQPAGEVQSVGGMAQLTEHQSLLTTLSQSFIVPPDPQYLSLDLRSLGLEAASGAIPDALEFSLLGDAHGSLVPTHAAGATSFFNAVGQIEGTPQIHLASGVMYADGHVQLDISQLVPGEQATLFIDLVGQPPGAGATATVDNVSIVPERIFSHSFVAEALPGPFAQASSIRIGDVDGDHWKDIVVSDSGADRLFVFNGLASPIDGHNFSQSSIDVSSFGHRPVGLSLHRLDSDSVTDIAVALADSARVLTPLSAELVNAQEGRCLPTIDFETDAQGSPLVPGELLAEQFASWGIHVSARGSQLEPQIADWPTGGRPKPGGATTSDQVLILRQAAGGHDHSDQDGHHDEDGHHSGDGHHDDDDHGEDDHGGACGRYDQGDTSDDRHRNQTGRGHELARGKGHDSDHEDSHDSSHGHHDHPPGSGDEGGEHAGERGTLVFAFESPVMLDELVVLRTRSSDRATVSLFAADGSLIKSVRVESSNPTTAQGLIKQTVPLTARNVARMELTLDSSQALAEIVFCDEEAQDGRALIAGPSQVDEGTAATLELSSPGFHAVEWTINWGDGTIDELPGDPAHASHVFAVGPATHSVIATARDSAGNVVRSNRLTIAVADTSRVFPTLDFEHSATGAELRAGERITDQFASLGITVSTNRSDKQSAVIFDSSKASGSSRDLGSPNKRFGGPGQGSGGASGVGENRNALGNVLVISKSTKNVDANEAGGALVFQFDQPVRLAEVHLLDIDKPGSAIRLFTTDGALLSSTSLADRGPNSFQIATLDASHVARMEIVLAGGGAVASIVSQRPSSGLSVQTITGSLASSPIAASSLTAHTASPDGLAIDGSTTAAADIAADVLGGVISIGQVVDGSLTSQEGTAEWTFPGIAGQQIYINFQELDNWLQSDLFAPDGQLVYSKTHYRASGLDSGTLTLPTSGNYKLRLTSTSSPSYRFQIFDIPGPDVQTAQLGTTNSGALDWPGRADHWTFEGSSGDRMFLDFLTLSTVVGGDLVVDVVAPSGTILSTRTSILPNSLDQGFTLTETGQYTLVLHAAFDGSQLPSYSFQLWQVPADDTDSLIYRQPVSGAIETPGARDQWQFEADAGQNVFLDFTAVAGGDVRFQLLEPNGELFSSVTFSLAAGLDREFILPASGRYTLLIDGAGTANLNTYQFVLWDIPPEIVEQATLNTTLSGTLVPGQSVPFEFQGNAGTPILLDVIESSSRALAVTLIQPDGQTLIDHAATNVLTSLPQTGTYRALVTSASQFALDAHGPYAFRIQDASAPKVGLPDSMGTEFVVAFPPNLREPFAPNNPAFFLSISSPVDTSGTVQIPGIGFTRSYSVTGGSTTTIALPSQVELSDSETITDKGILVTALDEVTVTGLDQLQLLTEGFTALPTDAVGSEYYVLGYSNTVTYVIGGGTNLTIAGTVDDTQVTITPSAAIGSHPAGVPFSITLDRGQAVTFHTSVPLLADLSGTRVSATSPISVFGGNTAARIPQDVVAANHLLEQLPPLNAWGRRFLTVPLAGRPGGDTFRIMAQSDHTEVRINGQLVRTLDAGQFDERLLTSASLIEGSAPLLVAQYANSSAFDGAIGDPFMMLVPSYEQYVSDITLSTPSDAFDINFVNLVVPTSAIGSVTLDDNPVTTELFSRIASSDYSSAQIPISVGSHRVRADAPLGVSVYGFAPFDAYGTFGGMALGSIADIRTLTLLPASAELPVGTLHTVTAAVADGNGQPLAGVRIDFVIHGAQERTQSVVTDRTGRASIQLTSDTTGIDTFTASVADRVQSAQVAWHAAAPTIRVLSPAPDSQLAVGRQLITGVATAGSPGAVVVEVTVDGRHVDALDAAGNFFAAIDLQPGQQTIQLATTDSLGQTAATTLRLFGVTESDGGFGEQNSQDVTSLTRILFSNTTFNRRSNRLWAEMSLINDDATPLDRSVAVRIDQISSAAVSLDQPDAVDADGHPLLILDSEIPEAGLAPGSTSQPIALAFNDPARDRFSLELSVLVGGNRPPRFVSTPEFQAAVGRAFRYAAHAVDPDSTRIEYALTEGPEGMTIEPSTGELMWTATADQLGTHRISIVASDARGGSTTQSFQLEARLAPPNRPPVFLSAPNTGALPGSDYRYDVVVRDADNDALEFELLEGPIGMTIDSATGQIRYDAAAAGTSSVSIQVSDGRGGVASQRFVLQVGDSSGIGSPSILSSPPVTASVGSQYVYSVTAADPTQTALTFALLEGPVGMEIDSQSGRIIWQPSPGQESVSTLVRIEVRNALGGSAAQSYAIAVDARRRDLPPAFISTPPTFATASEGYAYDALAEDPQQAELTYALATAPARMAIDSTTGRIAWSPNESDRGMHRVLVTATSSLGLVGYQQFTLSVRGVNLPPVFVSQAMTTTTIGSTYRYLAHANDTEDEVTYSLPAAPVGMLIDPRSGTITWRPTEESIGDQDVTVLATDARGLTAEQHFTLTVSGDTESPVVDLWLSQSSIAPGSSITVRARATDNISVRSLVVDIDGTPLPLDIDGQATFLSTAAGFYMFTATAIDASGNHATVTSLLRVHDPADTEPPTVRLDAPLDGASVTYLTDVFGTISDSNLERYDLEFSRLNADDWQPIVSRSIADGNPLENVAGLIGVFDPTLLQNDQYQIRLTAVDINGNTGTDMAVVDVSGNAKIGALQIPSSEACQECMAGDVVIPVAGGPAIEIQRQYSTLTVDESGDFGRGWQFCMAEPNLRETAPRSPFEDIVGQFAAVPMRAGDKVTITTPSCERVSFTFSPTLHTGVWSEIGSSVYDPRWIPDPGVDWQLYGESDLTRLTGISSGEFDLEGLPLSLLRYGSDQYIMAAISASYNPLGYQLIGKDGTRYHYSQSEGLLDVTDRHGNRLTMTADGLTSSSGQAVQFQRDDQGRITKIIDQQGLETAYTYSAAGELIRVDYPSGLSDTYRYTADHLLAAINDDNAQQQMLTRSFEYDAAGRLSATLNAFGYRNPQTYDLANRVQTNFDALGNATRYEYDLRGNVVRECSPGGDEVRMEYDADDNRTRIIDEMGNATSFAYDARGNTTQVTDALGNTTTFVVNAANNVVYQRDAGGGEYFYDYDDQQNIVRARQPGGGDSRMTYDAAGRLLSVTYVDGRVKRYEYGNLALPERIIERDGSVTEIQYNGYGHILSMIDPAGESLSFSYDDQQRPITATDALGGTTRMFYSGRAIERVVDALGNETRYVLDAEFRPLQIIHPDGGVSVMEYDANGRQVAVTNPVGNRSQTVYRPDGRIASQIDALGGTTTYQYDPVGRPTAVTNANGHRWQTQYDVLGYVTALIDPDGGQISRQFDAMGNLIRETDALGRTTSFEYNSIQRPTRIVDAIGGETKLEYAWDGRLLQEEDALGRVHRYEYDPVDRLTVTIDPAGGRTESVYDSAGNRVEFIDQRGASTRADFDALHRPIRLIDASGAVTSVAYDALGRVVRSIDPAGGETTAQYDSVGRLTAVTDAMGGVNRLAYDLAGNLLSSTDALERQTKFAYDALNRPKTKIDPLGEITRSTYDAVGNLKSLRDPLGNTTTFEYDSLERRTGTIDPQGFRTSVEYDAVGNVSRTIDRDGRTVELAYDRLDRLVEERWLTAGELVNRATYSYDGVGNLLSAQDANSHLSFAFDALDRPTRSEAFSVNGSPHVVLTSTYDAVGNRTSTSDNFGVSVNSVVDDRHLLTSRVWSGSGLSEARVDFQYDARGLLSSLSRYASTDHSALIGTSNYQYDLKGRLEDLNHRGAAGQTLVAYAYARDAAGQLTSETHHGHTFNYERDANGQLLRATTDGIETERLAYDSHGNRTGAGEVMSADNRLSENATAAFSYDHEGNLIESVDKTSGEVRRYSYDHRHRLVSATRSSPAGVLLSQVDYVYDAFNRLVARSIDDDGAGPRESVTTFTAYDGQNAWADYSADGSVTAQYLFGDGIDQLLARWPPAEGTAWYLTDHLGSVRDIAAADGRIIDTIEYDSFGRILSQTDPRASDRFAFTGREWESELGFYYYRARFYDPATGRFLSQDPLGFAAGDTNLYRYVGNNPLDFVDPSGNLALVECALLRQIQTVVNVACPVMRMAFDGSLASQDIDQQVQNSFELMNVAFSALPFGSGLALQTTLRAITIVQTSQALASLDVNAHLFTLLEVAETYAVEAARLYQQGAAATFQEALAAFAQSDNRGLLMTRLLCGAANMGLMVLSARARCFVEGTPVVVGIVDVADPLASQSLEAWGLTTLDVLAVLAVGGAIIAAQPPRRRQERSLAAHPADEFFARLEDEDERDDKVLGVPPPERPRVAAVPARDARTTSFNVTNGESSGSGTDAFAKRTGSRTVPCEARPCEEMPCGAERGRGVRATWLIACCLLVAVWGLAKLALDRDAVQPSVTTRTAAAMSASPRSAELASPLPSWQAVTQPIEAIRCGQRVLAELPPGVEAVNEPEPDPQSWRLVEVEMTTPDGDRVEVHLLRPRRWLEENGGFVAGTIPLRLEELGIEGHGAILRTGPCPPIAAGPGHVVTGTFRHSSNRLVDLVLVDGDDAISCTSGHPIWSEDRQDFVAAGSLLSGEQVRLHSQALSRVQHQRPHPGSASVFNLEINQHHVYHVGPQGLLVHNSGADCGDYLVESGRGPVTPRHFSGSEEGIELYNQANEFRDSLPGTSSAKAYRNIVVANVEVDGQQRVVRFANSPEIPGKQIGIHSEERLIQWYDLLKNRLGKDVVVRSVFSDRIPCGTNRANCAGKLGEAFGQDLDVFYNIFQGAIH